MRQLTQNMMDSGKKLVQLLDGNDYKPKAAFWIYDKDQDAWLLFLGEVNNIEEDDDSFSEKIGSIIRSHQQKLPELKLTDVVHALKDAAILTLFNSVVNTGDEILGINFVRENINDVIIDGVYLYRMNITELAVS